MMQEYTFFFKSESTTLTDTWIFFHIKSQRFYDLNWRSYFWFVEAVEFDQLHRKNFLYIKKSTCEIFIIYICSSISQNIQIGFFHSSQNNSCRILIVFSRILIKFQQTNQKKSPSLNWFQIHKCVVCKLQEMFIGTHRYYIILKCIVGIYFWVDTKYLFEICIINAYYLCISTKYFQ